MQIHNHQSSEVAFLICGPRPSEALCAQLAAQRMIMLFQLQMCADEDVPIKDSNPLG